MICIVGQSVYYSEIQELGASLVAISPQLEHYNQELVKERKLPFEVLSDRANQVAQKYGVAFALPASMRWVYHNIFKLDLPTFNGDDSWTLPMPARCNALIIIKAPPKIPAVFASNADAINPPAAAPPDPPMIVFWFCCQVVLEHPDDRKSNAWRYGDFQNRTLFLTWSYVYTVHKLAGNFSSVRICHNTVTGALSI